MIQPHPPHPLRTQPLPPTPCPMPPQTPQTPARPPEDPHRQLHEWINRRAWLHQAGLQQAAGHKYVERITAMVKELAQGGGRGGAPGLLPIDAIQVDVKDDGQAEKEVDPAGALLWGRGGGQCVSATHMWLRGGSVCVSHSHVAEGGSVCVSPSHGAEGGVSVCQPLTWGRGCVSATHMWVSVCQPLTCGSGCDPPPSQCGIQDLYM